MRADKRPQRFGRKQGQVRVQDQEVQIAFDVEVDPVALIKNLGSADV